MFRDNLFEGAVRLCLGLLLGDSLGIGISGCYPHFVSCILYQSQALPSAAFGTVGLDLVRRLLVPVISSRLAS